MADQEDITLGIVVGGCILVCFISAFWLTRKHTEPETEESLLEGENPV